MVIFLQFLTCALQWALFKLSLVLDGGEIRRKFPNKSSNYFLLFSKYFLDFELKWYRA
jgi:hypothetical protein